MDWIETSECCRLRLEVTAGRGSTGLEKPARGKQKPEVKKKNSDLLIGDFYYSLKDFLTLKSQKPGF